MKFSIRCDALAEAIGAAITSLPSRPSNPILGGVLVESLLGAVSFSSFNYDRATTRTVKADVADPDTALVSGRLLSAVGAALPKHAEATVTTSDSVMTITSRSTIFRLPLMHAVDYPQLPLLDAGATIGSVSRYEFAEAVKIIGALASTDPQPANLTYLNFTFEPASLWLCATDRYVLARRRLEWSGKCEATIVNVSAADMLATVKAIDDDPEMGNLEILWNGSMFGLRTASTTVVTRAMGEEFPDVTKVLTPATYRTIATVPVSGLVSMLRRASAIADDEYAQIDLVVDNNLLSAMTTRSASGNVVDSIEAEQQGARSSVALSSRRLANALAPIDHTTASLAFRHRGHLVSIHSGDIELDGEKNPLEHDSFVMLMGISGK